MLTLLWSRTRASLYCTWVVLFGVAMKAAPANEAKPVIAFPGAVGFGTETPGGRGGQVIKVTNLNAAGPGSFAAAVRTKGPRIVVFEVAA